MSIVDITNHEIKVFFRRLQVPAELVTTDLKSASTASGQDPDKQKVALNKLSNEELTKQVVFDKNVPRKVFANYEPKKFREDVVEKATSEMARFVKSLNNKKTSLNLALNNVVDARKRLNAISGVEDITLIDPETREVLIRDREFLDLSLVEVDNAIATNVPSGTSPRLKNNDFLVALRKLIDDIRTKLGTLNPLEKGILNLIQQNIDAIVGKSEKKTTLSQEKVARKDITSLITDLLALRSIGDSVQSSLDDLNKLIAVINKRINALSDEIRVLQADVNNITPFYEPILLDALLGPTNCTTNVSRTGSPGRANVTFLLPLESLGMVPDLFLAIKDENVFDLELIEKAPNLQGTETKIATGRKGLSEEGTTSFVSAQTINILKPNLRETTIRPFDMIQIWMKRRFAKGTKFPNDYYPVFTGFITNTNVTYAQSSVTVEIGAEDTAKIMRLARVNIDPAVLPGVRPAGINITPYSNYLQSPTFSSGAEIIRALVQGAEGTFLGLSQAEVVIRETERSVDGQRTLGVELETKVFKLATEFSGMLLNLFEDLNNRWKPYVNQFKSAYKLWETEYKIKWDIAREVAGITEYELYADNIGAINYHPPFYFLNPFDIQYLIRDVDIDSENHYVDETKVMTVADISSTPSYIGAADLNVMQRASSLVAAPQALIQRFGVRWAKKNIPIFSGIHNFREKESGVGNANEPTDDDAARTTYARAWLNRRNSEVMSAQVTLNGVPEIRVCNTVAFVGDPSERLKRLVKGSRTELFGTPPVQSSRASASEGLPELRRLTRVDSLTNKQQSILAIEGMQDILVYYVSEVTHIYVQGSQLKTRLSLTHGRHWTEPLPFGNVGFGINGTETNSVVALVQSLFGQDGKNPSEFVNSLAGAINFLSTGNPVFIPRPEKGKDKSQFGFSATTGRGPTVPEPIDTSGADDPVTPVCFKVGTFLSLVANKEAYRQTIADLNTSLKDFRNLNIPKPPILNENLSDETKKEVEDSIAKEKKKTDEDKEFKALNDKITDENVVLEEVERFAAGNLVPESLSKQPGFNALAVFGFADPIIAFTFVVKSTEGTSLNPLMFMENSAQLKALDEFKKEVAGGVALVQNNMRTLSVSTEVTARRKVTIKEITADGETTKTEEDVIVQGTILIGADVTC